VRDCAVGKRAREAGRAAGKGARVWQGRAREARALAGGKRKWEASARGRQGRAQDARARAECDGAREKRQLEMQPQKVQQSIKNEAPEAPKSLPEAARNTQRPQNRFERPPKRLLGRLRGRKKLVGRARARPRGPSPPLGSILGQCWCNVG